MYLVTLSGYPPFITTFFDPENHFKPGMTVYHIYGQKGMANYTTDGYNWQPIEFDSL